MDFADCSFVCNLYHSLLFSFAQYVYWYWRTVVLINQFSLCLCSIFGVDRWMWLLTVALVPFVIFDRFDVTIFMLMDPSYRLSCLDEWGKVLWLKAQYKIEP